MRVVHLAPFYHPVIGGVEEVVKRIAEYMASKGNEVYVVTYNRLRVSGVGSLPKEEVINNVNVIRLKPNFTWSHGTYSNELPKTVERIIPDLVHVHVWRHPHVFQAIKLREKLNYKTLLHTHAPFHTLSQLGLITWLYYKAIDWSKSGFLGRYDNLLTLTPHERAILVKQLGAREDKVAIVPNGIDDEFVISAQDKVGADPMVLYLGRISRSKNVGLLIKAMRYVNKEISNVKLVLAGPDEGFVANLRKFEVSFKYLGVVSETEKCRLLSECTVFAHPASYEPFGITLLEAQAFGKPCVITGNGGQRYVAPPETSLYAKPNPEDFGRAILSLLNDKELYRKLSLKAKEWASKHSWSKILPIYDEIYS